MNTAALPFWLEGVLAALLVVGGLFALVGSLGLLRFRDFYMRLHAPTKATTLGVGGVLLASLVLSAWRGDFGFTELLITLFLFVTAPVSANLMAQAAMHLKLRSEAGPPPAESLNPSAAPDAAAPPPPSPPSAAARSPASPR